MALVRISAPDIENLLYIEEQETQNNTMSLGEGPQHKDVPLLDVL